MSRQRQPNLVPGTWVDERAKTKRHGKILRIDRNDERKHHWLVEFEEPDGTTIQLVKTSAQLSRSTNQGPTQGPQQQQQREENEQENQQQTAPKRGNETENQSVSSTSVKTPRRPKRKAALNHKVVRTPKQPIARSDSYSTNGSPSIPGSSDSSLSSVSSSDAPSYNNNNNDGGSVMNSTSSSSSESNNSNGDEPPPYNWRMHLQISNARQPDSESDMSDDDSKNDDSNDDDDDDDSNDGYPLVTFDEDSSDDEPTRTIVQSDDVQLEDAIPNEPTEDVEPADERDFEHEEEHRRKTEIYNAEKKRLLEEEWSVDLVPDKPPLQCGSIVKGRGKSARQGKIVERSPDGTKWMVRFDGSQQLVEKSSQGLTQVWEPEPYIWNIVKDSEPEEEELEEYNIVGLIGFDFNKFERGRIADTLNTLEYEYPYLKLLQTLWPALRLSVLAGNSFGRKTRTVTSGL
ncbi:unknown protein [Seminavis robusta]|uniref:Uncharacterized protein n=1 Tax=Seminavis robusta TaxID=568900 RepID=A0A9N8HWJ8_9STRA|nr:unknown protein [Seminavis robusta]|eukprot:Sro2683_g334530.1 n/a (459) ;mRNA; r:3863-5378